MTEIDDAIRNDHQLDEALAALTRNGTSPWAAIRQAVLDAAGRVPSSPSPSAPTGVGGAPKNIDWKRPLSVKRVLKRDQLEEFIERGYIVIPDVVPPEILAAANAEIDAQLRAQPVAEDHEGPHFMFHKWEEVPALAALLHDTPAFSIAEELTGDGAMEFPWQVQTAMTYPPYIDDRGIPHIDGGMTRKADDPPRTFTMLAGFFLSDQSADDTGNLFVWPGTHRLHGEYFKKNGPESFTPYPDVKLPEREQVRGRPGDLLLKHYMLGHNVGDNTSDSVRRTVYFRLRRRGHEAGWREVLQNPWHDFTALRRLVPSSAD